MNWWQVLSVVTSVVVVIVGALNVYVMLMIENRIMKLRIYVTDNYVHKNDLDKIVTRLERLIGKLEAKLDDEQ